jgi:hypothetical protein
VGSEIDFLHFKIAAWSEGGVGGAEDGEWGAEAREEGAAVDVVEGVGVGPRGFCVGDGEVAVWWGTGLVSFVFFEGKVAYDVDWMGLRSLPTTVELEFWRAGENGREIGVRKLDSASRDCGH